VLALADATIEPSGATTLARTDVPPMSIPMVAALSVPPGRSPTAIIER
jgi:hypothetical protein